MVSSATLPLTPTFSVGAARAVETARTHVAALLDIDPGAIVWTSGATEANNLALFGVMRAYARKGRHLVTSKTEHKAVLDVCRRLEREGCAITYLDSNPDGLIPLERVAAALRLDTVLVSLMHVNNETGVAQDLPAIGALVRNHGALLHVDASQSAGKLPLDLQALPVDLLSPQRAQAVWSQGHRRVDRAPASGSSAAGTVAVRWWPGTWITGRHATRPPDCRHGEACRIARVEMEAEQAASGGCATDWQGLAALGDVELNGHPERNVAGILNVSFAGIAAEALLDALPEIALATGSLCTSASHEPSHVLRAMALRCHADAWRGPLQSGPLHHRRGNRLHHRCGNGGSHPAAGAIPGMGDAPGSPKYRAVDWAAP